MVGCSVVVAFVVETDDDVGAGVEIEVVVGVVGCKVFVSGFVSDVLVLEVVVETLRVLLLKVVVIADVKVKVDENELEEEEEDAVVVGAAVEDETEVEVEVVVVEEAEEEEVEVEEVACDAEDGAAELETASLFKMSFICSTYGLPSTVFVNP